MKNCSFLIAVLAISLVSFEGVMASSIVGWGEQVVASDHGRLMAIAGGEAHSLAPISGGPYDRLLSVAGGRGVKSKRI